MLNYCIIINNNKWSLQTLQEKEKVEQDMAENEKDITTEKQLTSNTQPSGVEAVADIKNDCEVKQPVNGDSIAEKTGETTIDDNKLSKATECTVESSTAENFEAVAEDTPIPKKEKVKKRWSFRSFSFSKKDKQKPAKKEEAELTNGECEKVPEEVSKFVIDTS